MRKLTNGEIHQLSEELNLLGVWESVIAFANKYFTGTVHRVSVETDYESNDQGGSYEYVSSLTVFDPAGKELPYNKDAFPDVDFSELENPDDADEISELIEEYYAIQDEYQELGATYGDYYADKAPQVSFKEVFVNE